MSGYTSGRTVKSSKAQRSPIAAATADARRIAKRHLGDSPIISSKLVAATDGTVRMGTTIMFSERHVSTTKALADAIAALPGYHSMCWNIVSISYLRDI